METAMDSSLRDESSPAPATMSKNAQKRLLKQQRYEAKKAEKKAQVKELKKKEAERKRKEWQEKLASVTEEEREKLIEEKIENRKERMEKRSEERGKKKERLENARVNGQNVVIDLEFANHMSPNELHSLVQQVMYCYAINGRCPLPAHIWLTGCEGVMRNELLRIPGYDKWVIEKEDRSYIEAFQDQKENLVNRLKGITMNKAKEQEIRTAKLPIGAYMKMASSQVLTMNQVVEILLKFLETKEWKDSFFQVIPLRKRCEADLADKDEEDERKDISEQKEVDDEDHEDGAKVGTIEGEDNVGEDEQKAKRLCIEP